MNTNTREHHSRILIGKVHNLEEPSKGFNQNHDFDNFELANQVIDTYLVELNMMESPPQI